MIIHGPLAWCLEVLNWYEDAYRDMREQMAMLRIERDVLEGQVRGTQKPLPSKHALKPKVCAHCQQSFIRTQRAQKWCPVCQARRKNSKCLGCGFTTRHHVDNPPICPKCLKQRVLAE